MSETGLEGLLLKLSRAVEQSPSTVAITDPQGNLEYVNPKFTRLTGYSSSEVLGKNPRVLKSGDKGLEEYKNLWQTITSGKEWRGEFHNKKKNGEIYYEAASISPIRDPSGQTIGYVKVAEDITKRVELERLRDDLTHMIVHDLKNPLTGIFSAAELFMGGMLGELTPDQKKFMETIQVSSKKLNNLIMDLLDIRKMEDNKLVPNKEEFKSSELKPALNWVFSLAQKENKVVKLDLSDDLVIFADKNLLIRVLENFLTNGLKHTPPAGTITLKISPQNGQTLFEVTDNGEGIPAEYLDQVFDKFFKVEGQKLKTQIDTGLGLAFCKLAVEAMGGKIKVESKMGKGSRFYFSLPLK